MNHIIEFLVLISRGVGTIAGAATFALVLHSIVYHILRPIVKRTSTAVDDSLVRHGYWPCRFLLVDFSPSGDTIETKNAPR